MRATLAGALAPALVAGLAMVGPSARTRLSARAAVTMAHEAYTGT